MTNFFYFPQDENIKLKCEVSKLKAEAPMKPHQMLSMTREERGPDEDMKT